MKAERTKLRSHEVADHAVTLRLSAAAERDSA